MPTRPNVILIVLDTLRADHLGCYGYFRDTSPNLDRLAREGIPARHILYATKEHPLSRKAAVFSEDLAIAWTRVGPAIVRELDIENERRAKLGLPPVKKLVIFAYSQGSPIMEQIARRDFGRKGAPAALDAWRKWSEAITRYVPTSEDQYGPFRVGPSYPLVFQDDDVEFPSASYAHFGSRILKTLYRSHAPGDVEAEIALFEEMSALWREGLEYMEAAVSAAPPLLRLPV